MHLFFCLGTGKLDTSGVYKLLKSQGCVRDEDSDMIWNQTLACHTSTTIAVDIYHDPRGCTQPRKQRKGAGAHEVGPPGLARLHMPTETAHSRDLFFHCWSHGRSASGFGVHGPSSPCRFLRHLTWLTPERPSTHSPAIYHTLTHAATSPLHSRVYQAVLQFHLGSQWFPQMKRNFLCVFELC